MALNHRIFTLDRWLRSGRKVVATEAARELCVDERTIRRDLKQVLAGQYGLPVRYDRGQRVWYSDGDAATLPGTLVSTADRLALLIGLHAAEQFRGTPVHGQLADMYRRLLDLLPPETRTGYQAMAKKIRFEGPPVDPVPRQIWDTLINTLEEPTTLQMVYQTAHNGATGERRLDPYGLIARHRDWYVIGYDHKRKAVRTFLLSRIRSMEDTGDPFCVRDGFDLDTYLGTALDSHQSTGPIHRVKLRFSEEAAAYGEEYRSNSTQKISRDPEGRVIVEFDTGALYAVERDVLAWGGRVEVLEPRELREAVLSSADRAATVHKSPQRSRREIEAENET